MLLPALSKAKAKAVALSCMSNNKQLALAWFMYAQDNNDRMVYNAIFTGWRRKNGTPSWVQGIEDWTTSSVNTNSPEPDYRVGGLVGALFIPPIQNLPLPGGQFR